MSHNDHLKEPALDRKKGTAAGIYYEGVAAVMRPGYILVAPNMTELHGIWNRLTKVPLNEEHVKRPPYLVPPT